jgi:hypothetical protein
MFALTVSKAGTGAGTVTSSPAWYQLRLAPAARTSVSGTVVFADEPAASPGPWFTGWTGACSGTGACSVTMDAAKSGHGDLHPGELRAFRHEVGRRKRCEVTMRASRGSIAVRPVRSRSPVRPVVALTATPDPRFFFVGWSGACSARGACSVTMDAAKTVDAKVRTGRHLQVAKETGAGLRDRHQQSPRNQLRRFLRLPGPRTSGSAPSSSSPSPPIPGSTFRAMDAGLCRSDAAFTCTLTMTGNPDPRRVKFDLILPAPLQASTSGREGAIGAASDVVQWTSRLEGRGWGGVQVAVNGQVACVGHSWRWPR